MLIFSYHRRVLAEYLQLIFGWTYLAYISASGVFFGWFSADRNSAANPDIRIRLGAIICPSVTRVDQSKKQLQLGLWNFARTVGSLIPLVFAEQVSSRNSNGSSRAGCQKEGWENKPFLALNVNISKTVEIRPKLLLMSNSKFHMRFRLTTRSVTLDDLKLL